MSFVIASMSDFLVWSLILTVSRVHTISVGSIAFFIGVGKVSIFLKLIDNRLSSCIFTFFLWPHLLSRRNAIDTIPLSFFHADKNKTHCANKHGGILKSSSLSELSPFIFVVSSGILSLTVRIPVQIIWYIITARTAGLGWAGECVTGL